MSEETQNREEIEKEQTAEAAAPEAAESEQAEAEQTEREKPHGKHEKLKEELARAQADAADFKDKWMRSAAEFDNFRKRNEQTRRNAYLDGKAEILLKILPVGDNLERALTMCDEKTAKGIEMVLRSFRQVLEAEGIEAIDPVGEEFDPTYCEAIMSEPAQEGVEPGYVKEVFLKGYKRGDKVLRFAQVKVTG